MRTEEERLAEGQMAHESVLRALAIRQSSADREREINERRREQSRLDVAALERRDAQKKLDDLIKRGPEAMMSLRDRSLRNVPKEKIQQAEQAWSSAVQGLANQAAAPVGGMGVTRGGTTSSPGRMMLDSQAAVDGLTPAQRLAVAREKRMAENQTLRTQTAQLRAQSTADRQQAQDLRQAGLDTESARQAAVDRQAADDKEARELEALYGTIPLEVRSFFERENDHKGQTEMLKSLKSVLGKIAARGESSRDFGGTLQGAAGGAALAAFLTAIVTRNPAHLAKATATGAGLGAYMGTGRDTPAVTSATRIPTQRLRTTAEGDLKPAEYGWSEFWGQGRFPIISDLTGDRVQYEDGTTISTKGWSKDEKEALRLLNQAMLAFDANRRGEQQ
jgi:hypothetical protein